MIKKICKYCGKPIPKGGVWNPDNNGNGYHHKCLIDMEFDENEAYMENLKKHSIVIPENATNRDVIKIIFPTLEFKNECNGIFYLYDKTRDRGMEMMGVDYVFLNEPYKGAKK